MPVDILEFEERRSDWANVCIRRTEVKELTSMAGDGNGAVGTEALFPWERTEALFARLNDSILGGINRVAWPASRARAQSVIIAGVNGRALRGPTYVSPSSCSFLYFC